MMGVLLGVLLAAAPGEAVNATQLKTTWKTEAGAEVTLAEVVTEPTVLAFIYTSCTATCPLTTKKLQRLEAELKKEGRAAKLVAVSLDPSHDTPAALVEYRKRYGLEGNKAWTILVGPEASVRTLTMLLDFRYSKNPESQVITHDNKMFVLAPGGAVVAQSSSLNDVVRPLLDAVPAVARDACAPKAGAVPRRP